MSVPRIDSKTEDSVVIICVLSASMVACELT